MGCQIAFVGLSHELAGGFTITWEANTPSGREAHCILALCWIWASVLILGKYKHAIFPWMIRATRMVVLLHGYTLGHLPL